MRLALDSENGWIGPLDHRYAKRQARARLVYLLDGAQGWLATMPPTLPADAARAADFARDQIAHIPLLLEAAENGDLWRAVLYALRVGHTDGRWTQYPQQVRASRKVTMVRLQRAEGGRNSRRIPPKDSHILVAQVHDRLSKGMKINPASKVVAEKYNRAAEYKVSAKTVYRMACDAGVYQPKSRKKKKSRHL